MSMLGKRVSTIAVVLGLAASTDGAPLPAWLGQLGYGPGEAHAVRLGPSRMPLVEVRVAGLARWLLFDTGNMAGLSLASGELARQSLAVEGKYDRLDSDGRLVGTYRKLHAPLVEVFGRTLKDQSVLEIEDGMVRGLVGPDLLPGTRFTLDYRAGLLAVTDTPLREVPPGWSMLPLVRSKRHPLLILAYCEIGGRRMLTEFDTGKSRSVIDPAVARELGLAADKRGVRVDWLSIGPLRLAIPSAKVFSLAEIDRSLPSTIEMSVGSDIMRQLLFTVDFVTNRLVFRLQPSA